MRSRVDPARQTTDHGEAGVSELIGKFFRRFQSVMRGAARTNHRDGVLIAFGQFAPDVKNNGRRMDLAKLPGIERRFGRDHAGAEVADAGQLRRKIDHRFPIDDLIGDFRPMPSTDRKASRRADRIRSGVSNTSQQLPQADRPHARKHVERDAGFGGGHRFNGAARQSLALPIQGAANPIRNGISSSSGSEGAALGGGAG